MRNARKFEHFAKLEVKIENTSGSKSEAKVGSFSQTSLKEKNLKHVYL
jgi:hypothetical protein